MANLNAVQLIGNLTREPEGRSTQSGACVTSMGIAINRKWKAQDGSPREETTFVDVEVWGKQAEFCRDYLRKGNSVFIQGRLKLDQWEDKNTGNKRQKLSVVGERVQSLEKREQQGQQAQPQHQYAQQPQQQQYAPQQAQAAPPFPSAQPQHQNLPQQGFDVNDEAIDTIPF